MNVTQFRTQLLLDEDRYRWLKETAAEESKSIAEIVRRTIDEVRSKHQKQESSRKKNAYQDLLKLGGTISGGPKDVSVNHDKYLGDWIYEHKIKNKR